MASGIRPRSNWPAGRVIWVRAGKLVTTREVGGRLAGIAAGDGQVDVTDADVCPRLPRWEAGLAPDYGDELDRLIGELRPQLTATSLTQDQRTPVGPVVDEHFRLLDLALDRATPAVHITFEWASEPDVRFVYEQPISVPPVTSSAAGDVLIFFVEEVHTGLVQRAEREHRDGVVALRPQ